MKPTLLLFALAVVSPLLSSAQSTNAPASAGLELALQLEDVFADLADRLYPSVVSVAAYGAVDPSAPTNTPGTSNHDAWRITGQASAYPGYQLLRSGSGFFLDEDGYILTCRHLLLDASGTNLVKVVEVETTGRRTVLSRIIGSEPTLNLALLKLDVFPKQNPPEFSVPELEPDPFAVRAGQWAIALGDPAGALRTYTVGNFSARPNRQCYQNDLTSTYLQACMQVHPEAYGGPMVNVRGKVVGIVTPRNPGGGALQLTPGVEFTMPIAVIKNIADALKVKGGNASPWLGFSILDLAAVLPRLRKENPAAARKPDPGTKRLWPFTGVYIDDLYDPSPASTAGIRPGDFLTAVNGNRLFSVLDFQKELYLAGIGTTAKLEIFRAGETMTLMVPIEQRPASAITH